MSERACHRFEKFQEKELVETAKISSVIDGFDQHECSTILKKYAPRLANCSVQKLMAKLIIDRGSIFDKYPDQERLPASIELENKVLQILIIIQPSLEISASGPKVDMLFVYNGVEISDVKFKKPGTTERDLAIQNKENVRLARCIQEAHAALGVPNPSILMVDIAGFVGVIYQVKPLKGSPSQEK
ncbi:hypothetical protein EC957_011317 [Mortierella hygrophila]|uniref:Uncharacterized protein n=1 Tax=Mortierella hygrophila TaxID=979708 RepID=A0A9P6K480_9FUNG|nr:hypothetical protein EC957_011317 [Mortierella hygrophila]